MTTVQINLPCVVLTTQAGDISLTDNLHGKWTYFDRQIKPSWPTKSWRFFYCPHV